jgi:diacylglycerol kinase (ATP)
MSVASAFVRPLRKLPQRLWPYTLGKFWGLHALMWAAAFAVAARLAGGAVALPVPLLLPLVAANAALATTLYRSREDANVALAATAALYFGGHAAMLFLLDGAGLAQLSARLAAALPWARAWHAALCLGSVCFALKAAFKDRLFGDAEAGSILRSEAVAALRASPVAMPTLLLLNGQAGAKLAGRVRAYLEGVAAGSDDVSIVDLAETAPELALRSFGARHPTFRVLVCGGDGTASWVLGAIEQCGLTGWDGAPYRPAVGLYPLGTGNDLARVLGWGKSVRLDTLSDLFSTLDAARVRLVDRWLVHGTLPEGASARRMCNYLSIGLDTQAALSWARLKHAAPWAFKLRLINKLW